MINCIQLYLPETLLIEYDDHDYSEDDFRRLFDDQAVFHIKMHTHCAFVHFYSHAGKCLLDNLSNTIGNLQIFAFYIISCTIV